MFRFHRYSPYMTTTLQGRAFKAYPERHHDDATSMASEIMRQQYPKRPHSGRHSSRPLQEPRSGSQLWSIRSIYPGAPSGCHSGPAPLCGACCVMTQYTTAARTYGALAVAYYCADRYAATPYIPTGLIALVAQHDCHWVRKKPGAGCSGLGYGVGELVISQGLWWLCCPDGGYRCRFRDWPHAHPEDCSIR